MTVLKLLTSLTLRHAVQRSCTPYLVPEWVHVQKELALVLQHGCLVNGSCYYPITVIINARATYTPFFCGAPHCHL